MGQARIWEYFQSSGHAADAFSGSGARYRFLASQISSGQHVLNIGIGRGGLEALLIEKGAIVSCLDPDEKSVEAVKAALQLGEEARTGTSQAMPFESGRFDVLVMSEVLEHLADDELEATLEEARRVLKPDGRFIGTVPADERLSDNFVLCPHCGEAFHRWGHVQSFTPARLRGLLEAHSLPLRRMVVRCFPDWDRPGAKNFMKSLVRYVLGRFGSPLAVPNIYFEANPR